MKIIAASLMLLATASPDPVPDPYLPTVYCWPCEGKIFTAEAEEPYELPPQCIACIEPIMIAQADSEPLVGAFRADAGASGGVPPPVLVTSILNEPLKG